MKVSPFLMMIICFFYACGETNQSTEESLTSHVDLFIGTGGHGHTYPGASAPFGRVQPSPDNGTSGWDWCSGYHISDSIISGFGQLHLSGTGIGDLADLLLMPTNARLDVTQFGQERLLLPYTSTFSHDEEHASPGYYSVFLDEPKVSVELSANEYVAYHQYSYKESLDPSFILDLGYAVNWDQPTSSKLEVEGSNVITGFRHSKGWAKNQKVFFVIESSLPISASNLVADNKKIEGEQAEGVKTGGQFFFAEGTEQVELKVALSSVSIENAKENLKAVGQSDFASVRRSTEDQWESLLSSIKIETPIDSLKTIFYTALYHTQIAPTIFNDVNGEFRLQNDSIATANGYKAYSTLSLWDVFRAETALLGLMDEELVNDMIKTMLAYYDESGLLPVWVLSGNETGTMPGFHSVSVIAEAFVKGIRGYDVEKAYDAMKATMMSDVRGLKAYKEYGYIPYDAMSQSVSISLETAYNDWCVGQVAKALGKEDDYEYFNNRSKAYQHFFDPNSGFLRGKSLDGKTFHEPFDPKFAKHIEGTDYTEGNAWQHSWYVLHDVEGLINLHGGNESFVKMAEQLFLESSELTGDNVSPDISGLIGQYAHGNEPSHHIAYMFNKAGKPWRTQFWVREILSTQYSTLPDGLSGNEDCGQMSAWYIMSSLGLYPMNPASGQYEIGSPLFESAILKLSNGKSFTIKAPETSAVNKYVQSVSLNGNLLDRTYIHHSEIAAGGLLEFEMGSEPKK